VFTPANEGESRCGEVKRFEFSGVCVRHVGIPAFASTPFRRTLHFSQQLAGIDHFANVLHVERHLSAAFENEDGASPFDIVHGADWGLTSYSIPRREGLIRVVRSSAPAPEYRHWWGTATRPDHWLFCRAERILLSRADLAYAPCKRTVEYYHRKNLSLELIRPPFTSRTDAHPKSDVVLPPRFLLHFGNINRVKGSDRLARVLLKLWHIDPDVRMVWAGHDEYGWLPKFRRFWGGYADRVTWLGSLPRLEMHEVLLRAAAVVAPSRVDNLPNNVLEAQAEGIPVIGTRDSSIDEIVEHNSSGLLVSQEDDEEIVSALARAWRGQPPFDGRCPLPGIFAETHPDLAIDNLLDRIRAAQQRASTNQTSD
jgi:glycosyltransferase involved in cell wall biosynthesis